MKFSEFDPATSAPALTDNLVGLTVPVTANSNRRWTFQQLVGAMPGAIFYVSPSGNDTNDGLSTSSPWKTITKVNASSFNQVTILYFRAGKHSAAHLFVRRQARRQSQLLLVHTVAAEQQ